MQQGFLLEFDRGKSRLGFSRRGCAVSWCETGSFSFRNSSLSFFFFREICDQLSLNTTP
jgi:hypothetical protein